MFAGFVTIFCEFGLKDIDSNTAASIRAFVTAIVIFIIILGQKNLTCQTAAIDKLSLVFVVIFAVLFLGEKINLV